MSRLDRDIRGLSFCSAQRLMDQDLRVGKRISLTLCTACQKEGAHAGSHSDTDRRYVALDKLHCVIDRHTCGNGSAGAVDIELNVLIGIFSLKEQHLGYDELGRCIRHLIAEENDPLLKETGKNIVGTLAGSCLFDYIRNKIRHFRSPIFYVSRISDPLCYLP